MNKALPICGTTLLLIAVLLFPRLAAAAAPGPAGVTQPQLQPTTRPLAKPPAQTLTQPQAATEKPTVKALPLVRRNPGSQLKPVLANVDLRPDVVASLQTEPSLANGQKYNPSSNMGKPLKVTAAVENGGVTKADKVAIVFKIFMLPGSGGGVVNPFHQPAQTDWEYHYTADLGPGEAVSYPFDVKLPAGLWDLSVSATFAGDEKNKLNNGFRLWVAF